MEEEFYATIKFKNKEEIFSKVSVSEEKDETILLLLSPIIVFEVKDRVGDIKGYKVEPWLKTTDENLIVVKMSDILTILETKSIDMITLYETYLNNYNKRMNNYSKITKEMGYISSIKDAIKLLENIYNNH